MERRTTGDHNMTNPSIELIETRRARRCDPDTSKASARKAAKFAASHAGRIYHALMLNGPMTAHELNITGLTVVQCDRRLPELESIGLVRVMKHENGKDVVRNGARVWEAV
jgi:hypothetical protein